MNGRFGLFAFSVVLMGCPSVDNDGDLDAGTESDDAGAVQDAGCEGVDAGVTECGSEGDCEAMRVDFRLRLGELIELRRGCTTDDDCVAIEPALTCDDGFVFARRCPTAVRRTALCSYQQGAAALSEEACGVCSRAGCTEDDRVTGECSGGTTALCVDGTCVQ